MWDWAGVAGDAQMRGVLADAARRFYVNDRHCPIDYEPSGEDFLSPCLGEADFMRRVLDPPAFGRWLSEFLPGIPEKADSTWLPPAVVTDRADPKLAHIDGLDLSRAWMLGGIAHRLEAGDLRGAVRKEARIGGKTLSGAGGREGVAQGRGAGARGVEVLGPMAPGPGQAAPPAVTGEHYEGGHWLGTFAVYLTSGAGFAALR